MTDKIPIWKECLTDNDQRMDDGHVLKRLRFCFKSNLEPLQMGRSNCSNFIQKNGVPCDIYSLQFDDCHACIGNSFR